LALMFIPVPIKAKYFVPGLVLVDLYLGISWNLFFGGGGIAHFASRWWCFVWIYYYVVLEENQFNQNRWN
jgi:hypothetical protein